MRGFPMSFLDGFLLVQNVSCFPCEESHGEFRKHSMKSRVNRGGSRFPTLATCLPLGNIEFPLNFLEGFQCAPQR
jgi:hypothetical protein